MKDLDKRYMHEFLIRLIRERARAVSEAINKRYDKFIYSEKVKYSQSKEYWRLVHRGMPKDKDYGLKTEKEKLGVWVPNLGARSKGEAHITSSSNCDGKKSEVNPLMWSTSGGTSPIGYKESVSQQEFFSQELKALLEKVQSDCLGTLVCQYILNSEKLFENDEFQCFYSSCVENSGINLNLYLLDVDDYIKKSNVFCSEKNCVVINRHYFLAPSGLLKQDFVLGSKELGEVCEDCVVEVEVLEARKTSSFVIITSIYPHLKDALGRKIGDCFNLPGINLTYEIKRIYN